MSTPIIVPLAGAPAGGTVNVKATIAEILAILDSSLRVLTLIPVVGAPAGLADAIVGIIRGGMQAFTAASGQSLDLTKIPYEAPVV